jgi:hypothetical protein
MYKNIEFRKLIQTSVYNSSSRVNNWVEENRLNLSQQALAFDVNAEVEPVPQDDEINDLFGKRL